MGNINRRMALASAAAATGAAVSGASAAGTIERPKTDLIRVGAVALHDYSHIETIWGPAINQIDPAAWPVGRSTRMLITHCWDRDPKIAEAFAKKYGCEPVKRYDDMVGKVDGMIFGGFYECRWWPKLTRPYLEAGIPCHINRPFALSMKAAREIVDTASKHNTPILCTDEREYIQQALVGRAKVEELLREGFTVAGANGDNSAGNEYPAHGVHGLYFTLAILGLDVERIGVQGDAWWNTVTPGSPKAQTWMQITLQYRGINFPGVPEQKTPFVASQLQTGAGGDAGIRIYYGGKSRGYWDTTHPWTYGERMQRIFYLFYPTVIAMQRMFETRTMQWDYDYILRKTRIFLAGFKSLLDHDGAMIPVAGLPEDWEAPCPFPDWIDESIFRR